MIDKRQSGRSRRHRELSRLLIYFVTHMALFAYHAYLLGGHTVVPERFGKATPDTTFTSLLEDQTEKGTGASLPDFTIDPSS